MITQTDRQNRDWTVAAAGLQAQPSAALVEVAREIYLLAKQQTKLRCCTSCRHAWWHVATELAKALGEGN